MIAFLFSLHVFIVEVTAAVSHLIKVSLHFAPKIDGAILLSPVQNLWLFKLYVNQYQKYYYLQFDK